MNNTDEYHKNNPEQKKSQTSYSSHTKFFKSQNRYYRDSPLRGENKEKWGSYHKNQDNRYLKGNKGVWSEKRCLCDASNMLHLHPNCGEMGVCITIIL